MPWTEINGVRTFVASDATTAAGAPAPMGGGKKNWFARHKVLTGLGAGVLVITIASGASGSGNAPKETAKSATPSQSQLAEPAAAKAQPAAEETASAAEETEVEAPAAPAEAPAKPAKPATTRAQDNAVRKAESYLGYSAFSRKGLIDQLKFEDFSTADATYGVDHVDVSWNEQAAKKAESYLEYSAFSRTGLIEQLEFEGFTAAQARHGAAAAGM
jgi:hypothetical protein